MASEKILIVDDEVDVLDLIKRILELKGYQVETAHTGRKAIELAQKENFDLLLADIRMPGMSGLEVAQAIKQFAPNITCVTMTGFSTMDMAIEALKLGVDEFIMKPFSPDELSLAISKALDKERLRRENFRLRSLIPLFELNKTLMGTVAVEEVLHILLDISKTETKADLARIYTFEQGEIVAHFENETNDEASQKQREASSQIAQLVFENSQQLILNLQNATPQQCVLLEQLKAQFVIATPLKSQESNLGALILARLQTNFSTGDSDFLSVLASQAGIALENAYAYNEVIKNTTTKLSNRIEDKINGLYIPYIAGPPIVNPQMFFGRQSDFEKIIGLLLGNFVMVIGPRRIGKTSLLHQLTYHLPRLQNPSIRFVPVLVSVEGMPEAEFFHMVMEEIVTIVQENVSPKTISNLSFDLSNPINYSPRAFSRDLHALLRDLQGTTPKPTHLVLLLDEMDTFNRYSLDTQSQLRRIFQRFANTNLSVVVAGVRLQQHWAGESSPFYNMFVPIMLTSFPETEAYRLITEPVKGIYNYDNDAVACILEATLGLPHRIQQLCLETINHLLANSKSRTEIKVEDVDTVLQTIHWLDESEKSSIETGEFEHEFEVAREVQETLLFKSVPKIPGLQISGRILRARQIGGDFFYIFPIGKDQLGVAIGDVSGKGIPAALYMAGAITAIDAQIGADLGPGELLNKLNHILYNRLQENNMNVALQVATFALLREDTNESRLQKPQGILMTIANAGIIAPIGATKQGCRFLPIAGVPVGEFSPLEQGYQDDTFLLDPFTSIIFTSDGIVEAQNEARELFGFERLEATINEIFDTGDAEIIAEHVINTVQKFVGRAGQRDDMTVVVVKKI